MSIKVNVSERKIELMVNGKSVFTGNQLIEDFNGNKFHNLTVPSTAAAAIKGNDKIQWLSEATYKIAKQAVEEYKNRDEVRLPKERAELRGNIQDLYSKHEWAREQDYENDIGFHLSLKVEKEIELAEKELKDFDENHPEIRAEFDKQQEIKTTRNIQAALNA